MASESRNRKLTTRTAVARMALAALLPVVAVPAFAATCARTLTAEVVAFDQPLMYNRLGASNINGMMYALRRDVVSSTDKKPLTAGGAAVAGAVELRPDKRPRPLVLRIAAGDCLKVTLQNLLTTAANPFKDPRPATTDVPPFALIADDQVADRTVGFHVNGMQVFDGIDDDSSAVGRNASSLVP